MDKSSSVHHFPDEIIELILSNCPIKSVGRFKSVSKSWQSIISSSRFSGIHCIQRSRVLGDQITFFLWKDQVYLSRLNGLNVIRLEEDEKLVSKSESLLLGFPSSGKFFEPLCSCNGIILLHVDRREYMLWNPFIRKHITIPVFNPNTHRKAFTKWAPRRTHPYPRSHPRPHLYHDSETDDYKIVFHYELRRCYTVYSCRNGSWGEIKDFPDLDWKECVYGVNGSCLYGLCKDYTEIISFDAREEKLHKLVLPEGVDCLRCAKLEAVSGRLCLYGFDEYHERRLHLWVMEENGSFDKSWRKLISMEKEDPDTWAMRPVYLTNKGDVVLQAKYTKLTKNCKTEGNFDAHFIYKPRGNCTFEEIKDFSCWKDIKFFLPSENLDMPYSNTPPSTLHKRKSDPTSSPWGRPSGRVGCLRLRSLRFNPH